MGFMSRLLEKYQHWASDQIREWQVHTVRASTKKIKDVAFTNIADDDVDNGGDDDGDNDCDDYGDDGGDDDGDDYGDDGGDDYGDDDGKKHTSYLSFFLHGNYFWVNFSPHNSA